MHSIASRFVTEPSNILFSGVYVCTFQPGNFTSWGNEGVNKYYVSPVAEDIPTSSGITEVYVNLHCFPFVLTASRFPLCFTDEFRIIIVRFTGDIFPSVPNPVHWVYGIFFFIPLWIFNPLRFVC